MLEFIPYQKQYESRCIEIFRSNIPEFFLENEVPLFLDYLENHAHQNYWCMAKDGVIIGCGGFALETPQCARLVWGIVHSDFHKKGYGRAQVEFRIQKIIDTGTVEVVQLDTSQHNPDFFKKFGFTQFKVTPEKYGPNLHSHELELRIERNKK